MFDYYLAPYVALSYVKQLAKIVRLKYELNDVQYQKLKSQLIDYRDRADRKLVMNEKGYTDLEKIVTDYLTNVGIDDTSKVESCFDYAYNDIYDETFQAMEAFIHNLNTMHCLPASEKIWVLDVTTNEFKSITMEDLDNSFESNKFKVISLNKETGKAEFKFITACKKLGNNRKLVKIKDSQGRTVRVTDNHRVMTISGLNITEKEASVVDNTISPRKIQFPSAKYDICISDYDETSGNDHVLIDENFAEFMGYYMSSGYIDDETSSLCIKTDNKVIINQLEKLIEKTFGYKVQADYSSDNSILLKVGIAVTKMIKDKFGGVDSEKVIPTELMFASNDVKEAFLKAYLTLSGTKLSPTNKELQAQLVLILNSLGISNSTNEDKYNISVSYHDLATAGISEFDKEAVEIPEYDLSIISKALKVNEKLTYSELDDLISSTDNKGIEKFKNIFISNIESKVEYNSGEEYVYDISVEDNENFLTYECIYVHNSRAGRSTAMVEVPVTWETLCPAV